MQRFLQNRGRDRSLGMRRSLGAFAARFEIVVSRPAMQHPFNRATGSRAQVFCRPEGACYFVADPQIGGEPVGFSRDGMRQLLLQSLRCQT